MLFLKRLRYMKKCFCQFAYSCVTLTSHSLTINLYSNRDIETLYPCWLTLAMQFVKFFNLFHNISQLIIGYALMDWKI